MKLLSSRTSPYVRKVLIVAELLGISATIQCIEAKTNPTGVADSIASHNPLGQVPTLVLDNGQNLHDSRVICEYLATTAGDQILFPPSGPKRWTALTMQSLADGMLDAALAARYESTIRPVERRWETWSAALLAKVTRALESIEPAELSTEQLTIGEVTLFCALGYLDFRHADFAWRLNYPKLAEWNAALRLRPEMKITEPA